MKKPLRIAFLTPEFVTEGTGHGGLSSYVYRISKTLQNLGHEVEVFVDTQKNNLGPFEFEGIRVERVGIANNLPFKVITRYNLDRRLNLRKTYFRIRTALGVSQAFAKRENEKPFDFVQSSDLGFFGLFVKKLPQRPLLVRCSWVKDLCFKACGTPNVFDVRCESRLERMLIRRADISYAPSKFVADYYFDKHGLKLETLRPPFLLDAVPSKDLPWELPERFLLHFGTLGPVKGTNVLAAALPLVWREEPDFSMVWAGEGRRWTASGFILCPNLFEEYSSAWGEKASQVTWLGLIKKTQLYAVLKRAEATVLPSCCDNLPNTAIESIAFGVPVIGTRGSSIDELVEHGINGEIVPMGDPAALAKAMLRVWRREVSWMGHAFRRPALLDEMEPRVAASNLIKLAGFNDQIT